MNSKFAVVIGRFQPIHNGHIKLIKAALNEADDVIIVTGSHRTARTVKNPWTSEERALMIRSCFSASDAERLHFAPVHDYFYSENQWLTDVQQKVKRITGSEKSISLVGNFKDDSSYYLKSFPKWKLVQPGLEGSLNATDVRNSLFTEDSSEWLRMVSMAITPYLLKFKETELYENLVEEFQYYEKYREAWKSVPYPVTFVTTDTVVKKSGHVLVVRRKFAPGKGLIALPGGFIGQKESILDSAIRELKEETRIRIPSESLKAQIKDTHQFDYWGRSLRGRTITHGFYIDLGNGKLPEVLGDDDASEAWWMSTADVEEYRDQFFEDHFAIIMKFLTKY